MPRLKNRDPKYRKHASGQAIVTLSGKDIYLGKHGTAASRHEYDRQISQSKANNRTIAPKGTGDYSVAELVQAYWSDVSKYNDPDADRKLSGELWSIKMVLRVVNKLYGDTDVRDFGPLALRTVREDMVKLEWSRKYINKQVSRIRRMFKWGSSRELVPSTWRMLEDVEPLIQGRTDAPETAPVSTVDDAHVDAVLPFLSRHIRAMVQLQRLTAMRPGEVIIMRAVDVNMTNPALWEYRPAKHKNKRRGHDRVIYLNTNAQEILRPFIGADLSAFLFRPCDADAERRAARAAARKTPLKYGNSTGTNVVKKPLRKPGERYNVDSYWRAIIKGCDKANRWAKGGMIISNDERLIPRWHPHQIRHNTATKLRAEHGLEAAQVILGHRTLSATQIYAEKNVAKAKKIMMGGK